MIDCVLKIMCNVEKTVCKIKRRREIVELGGVIIIKKLEIHD